MGTDIDRLKPLRHSDNSAKAMGAITDTAKSLTAALNRINEVEMDFSRLSSQRQSDLAKCSDQCRDKLDDT
eukprot:8632141-Pyramimonas_sp.AAC.1